MLVTAGLLAVGSSGAYSNQRLGSVATVVGRATGLPTFHSPRLTFALFVNVRLGLPARFTPHTLSIAVVMGSHTARGLQPTTSVQCRLQLPLHSAIATRPWVGINVMVHTARATNSHYTQRATREH